MKEKKLGFGCMRMPLLDPDDLTSFDYEKIEQLFDRYLEQGFTYFDVAYTYHGYHAEEAVKKALVERYPREKFQLATKLPLRDFKDEQDLENIFQEQLDNCGVEYFDFYLLHNMGHNVYSKCCKYHVFDFVQRMKEEGKINEIGMSFHDTPELLDEVLSQYGDKMDFVQLQINYLDWEQPNIQSQKCLEIANKYHKPVTVMEPCKGGMLSRIPEAAEKLMKEYSPEDTPSSWAAPGKTWPTQPMENGRSTTTFTPALRRWPGVKAFRTPPGCGCRLPGSRASIITGFIPWSSSLPKAS